MDAVNKNIRLIVGRPVGGEVGEIRFNQEPNKESNKDHFYGFTFFLAHTGMIQHNT